MLEKGKRLDWNKLKVKFMTGDYKSVRDFARKEDLCYNGNFLKKTKGWSKEKAAKGMQMGCKIVENFMREEMEKIAQLNEKIQKVSEYALDATEKFFENGDYQRYIHQTKGYIKDKEGNFVYNRGYKISGNITTITESSFIHINKVANAVNVVNKVSKTLKNIGVNLMIS